MKEYNIEKVIPFLEHTSGFYMNHFSYIYFFIFRKGVAIKNHIILHVYYGTLHCSRYIHDTHQNWLDFLASTGGLLGLVLGFSFLTGFELIYLLIIRTFFVYMNSKFGSSKKRLS